MRDVDVDRGPRVAAGPRRRRRGRAVRRVARPRRPDARARDPRRPRRRPAAARAARRSPPARSPARSTPQWRRTSYSSLSKVEVATGAAGAVASEPEVVGKDDEELEPPSRPWSSPPVDGRRAVADGRRCRSARRSARSCTRCSSTPTRTRPTCAPSCSATSTSSSAGGRSTLDREELADALVAVCDSPLGPLADTTLREVPLADRLREMDFELPLGDGLLGDLAPLLERHLPDGDPVRAYADALAGPLGEQTLRGYLTGSVDVVLRLARPALPGGRLQDQLARPDATSRSPRTATAPRRWTPRWATPTTRCRRCCTPRCCTGSCAGGSPATTPSSTSAACSTSTCAACAAPTRRWSTGRRAASSRGGRRSRWSRSSPTCSTVGAR